MLGRKTIFTLRTILFILIIGIGVGGFFLFDSPNEEVLNTSDDIQEQEPIDTSDEKEEETTIESPVYKDPDASIEDRVTDLLSQMSLDEKIGQMVQPEKYNVTPNDVRQFGIGSILSGGGAVPDENTPEGWADMVDEYQLEALDTRLQIPIIYGIDAVHGHNNVKDATIFPHNIGLGAANDVDLMKQIGEVTAKEVRSTGISYTFAPCLCSPQNIRWGRTYEGYSEQPEMVGKLGSAIVEGLQGLPDEQDFLKEEHVAASIKHFVGDGLTYNGIDQGDVSEYSEEELEKHIEPFDEAIQAGARTVMISFSSINGLKTHGDYHLITEVLKGDLEFTGFVISDYNGAQQIVPDDFEESIKQSINAGIDLFMIPTDWQEFITTTKQLVEDEEVSIERIDDAVTRILRVKFENGLFEQPLANRALVAEGVGSDEHRALARDAVRKSQVLLKNDNDILPLAKDNSDIVVVGRKAANIGFQSGGWTMEWQGSPEPDLTEGTTILAGIEEVAGPNSSISFSTDGEEVSGHDVAIIVVGEEPYAEFEGDSEDLRLSDEDISLLETVKESGTPMVVLLLSGRPMIVTEEIDKWDAFVASWLPGSEGAGIADVLFGEHPFTGKLSYTWPKNINQVNNHDKSNPLFPIGYGLE
ncbi:glycoside hydrolase family 3 protein [Aquibacillus halophilus]|nr:glycoside hydrolase family 3 N-terminal domain-containing protein [Aquibacillus halophilus]